jgi:hypothetical protein
LIKENWIDARPNTKSSARLRIILTAEIMAEPDEGQVKADDLLKHWEEFSEWMRATLGDNVTGTFSDNDWTFIVKLHAMIETALNAALVRHFDAPELSGVIAKLDTANTATGKIAFAKALTILEPSSVVFVQKLSELRNFCVHDIRNFTFDLGTYFNGLTKQKHNELMNPILKMVKEKHRSTVGPKEAIFIGGLMVMMQLHNHDLACQTRAAQQELQRLQAESLQWQKEPTTTEG